jgi:hypothetical protein
MIRVALRLACGLICLVPLAAAVHAGEATVGVRAASPAAAEPAFEPRTICRTAIAAIMDRDPKLVQATVAADGVVVLTHARPIDNFVFTYRCRLEGDRVLWADEPGRWRDGAKDKKVFFEIVGDGAQIRVIENHADGTTTKQLFDRSAIE